MKTASKAPTFTTIVEAYVDVDVDIHPSELEAAGWVYQQGIDPTPSTHDVLDRVRRWHDRAHLEPWRYCRHDLCAELNAELNREAS